MKYVDSGQGKLPLISLIAILSISLTVNLPGLGISPIEDKLQTIFKDVSELEIQLLTVLPNLFIIPFILLSGKICTPKNQLYILGIGLIIYVISGILYLFADSMSQLIIISCILGIGCGLVIPLAASLIATHFSGHARVKQLGNKSGVSNFTVIIATLFVGWIANFGWHWAFLVYLIPIIPLVLIPFMSNSYINKYKIEDAVEAANSTPEKEPGDTNPQHQMGFSPKKALMLLAGIIGLYVALTYTTEVVSYYLPFTMGHYKIGSTMIGVATSAFFLAATLAGFSLNPFIRKFGAKTPYIAISMCVLGLFMMGVFHWLVTFIVAVLITGYGYGIMQPIIYDKTTVVAPTKQKANAYFSYVLTGNYVAIVLVPFIVQLFARIFNAHGPNFSYFLNGSILAIVLVCAFFLWRNSFVFRVGANQYNNKKAAEKVKQQMEVARVTRAAAANGQMNDSTLIMDDYKNESGEKLDEFEKIEEAAKIFDDALKAGKEALREENSDSLPDMTPTTIDASKAASEDTKPASGDTKPASDTPSK